MKLKLTLFALLGFMVLAQRRRFKPKITRVPPVPIYGRIPGKVYRKRPLQVRFFVAVGGVEKLFAPPESVRDAVAENAGVLPGIGSPAIAVKNVKGGYSVSVRWYDSGKAVTPEQVKRAIETVDPRLKGRVSRVQVTRGK